MVAWPGGQVLRAADTLTPQDTAQSTAPADIVANSEAAQSISTTVRNIFAERADAVVRVEALDRHGKLCGTGFFIDPMGTALTLYTTVGDASDVTVIAGDERIPAQVVTADPRSGLAIVKVDRSTPFLPSGKSRDLRLADPVLAIGYPMDLGASPSFGIIGGFDRKYSGKFFVTTHIRANLPVQAGFGGAPLLNFQGEVVGILVAGIDTGGACFALPIEAVEKVVRDTARFGEARHGWVGVTVEEEADGTIRIAELGPETPAAKSGLRAGDRILRVGSLEIDEVEDVLDASFFLTEGDEVTISVQRDGGQIDLSVTSATHPAVEKPEVVTAQPLPGFPLK